MTVTIDNAIKAKSRRLRNSGKSGLVVSYPFELADTIGLKAGDQMECFQNDKGEFVVRPAQKDGVL